MTKKTDSKRKLPRLQVEDLKIVSGGQGWTSAAKPGPPNWSSGPGGNSNPGWPTVSAKKK
jgi:hypothetical protein